MHRQRFAIAILSSFFLLTSLMGCAGNQDEDFGVETVSQPSQVDPHDIQPDIHTNLPPPTEGASLQEEIAQKFFEKKDQMDGFSDPLKDEIAESVEELPDEDEADGPIYYTLMGGTMPTPMVGGDCDVTSEFICIDEPQPAEGFDDIFTVDAGVDVLVRLDLNQLAVFSATDPVAVVSVFNNDGGSASEVLIMPEDVQSTGEPDVGLFQTAIALGGFGKFTVVVSAYQVVGEGETQSNDLSSKSFNVFRTSTPEIELVEARPVISGVDEVVGEPVDDGDTVSGDKIRIKVKLTSPFSPGVQIRFENYDEEGYRRSFAVVGYVSTDQPGAEDGEMIYTGNLLLHNGLNEIDIVAANPEADEALGASAPPPQVLNFSVYNFFGAPKIKILSPKPDQPLVEQMGSQGQKVQVQFCYTLVPDLVVGGGGGTEDSDECVTGSLGGLEPKFSINGRRIGAEEDDPFNDALDYNGAQGVFTAQVTPQFGVNLFHIQAVQGQDEEGKDIVLSTDSGSFLYGVPMKLIEDGELMEADSFTQRGLNVDIDEALIEGDIRDLIVKFVNRPETSDLVLGMFKKTATTPGYTCGETDPPAESKGNTSIEFIEDSFSLGSIELLELETANDGMLHVSARINGLHGEADMVDLNGPIVTYNGQTISFIPLTLSVARLDISLGVKFRKDNSGNLKLDLRRIEGQPVVQVIGDGPLGSFVSVNTDRNPFAAGLEFLQEQQGLVTDLFDKTLETTFLCGIENGVNHDLVGVLGKAAQDIEKLKNYNQNPFRLSFDFDIEALSKSLGLDVAINLPKGDIKFDEEGIHVQEVPIRVNPRPGDLTVLALKYSEGILGAVSRRHQESEAEPLAHLTNDTHKLGLLVGEDVINQALFAANLSGLLNLDIDANFYANLGAVASDKLLPNGSMFLTQGVDVNMDGNDQNDADTPVLLQVRTDPKRPPMVTFLTEDEVKHLAAKEQEILDASDTGGDGDGDGDGGDPAPPEVVPNHFKEGEPYFRFAVSGLELAVFEQEKVDGAAAKQFCNVPLPHTDNPTLKARGLCEVPGTAKTMVNVNDLPANFSCPDEDLFTVPQASGAVISRPVKDSVDTEGPVPLFRVRLGLVLFGQLKGINREIPAKDRLLAEFKGEEPEMKNIFRAKLVPELGFAEGFLRTVEVLENHTEKPDALFIRNIEDFLRAALGNDCETFNEIKVPVPSEIAFDNEEEGIISDLGLAGIDLGSIPAQYPEVFIDDNRLFLDVLVFADLIFDGEAPIDDLSS